MITKKLQPYYYNTIVLSFLPTGVCNFFFTSRRAKSEIRSRIVGQDGLEKDIDEAMTLFHIKQLSVVKNNRKSNAFRYIIYIIIYSYYYLQFFF